MSRRSLSQLRSAIGQRMRLREPRDHDSAVLAPVRPLGPSRPIKLLDWAMLSSDHAGWPAGTIGAVIDIDGPTALFEIADDLGYSIDLFDVPVDLLQLSR